jgi:hypothetical protein
MPDIARPADPVRLRSGWINGIKHLPVSYVGWFNTAGQPATLIRTPLVPALSAVVPLVKDEE